MKCAVYRLFYGEDFIRESIESIYDYVDKVFVCWTDRAFKGVDRAIYKGTHVVFPRPIDRAVEIVQEMKIKTHPKIEMIYDYWPNIDDQFRHQINDLITPNYGRPTFAVSVESDMVIKKSMMDDALREFKAHQDADQDVAFASMDQIFMWRTPDYRLECSRWYSGLIFWDFTRIPVIPKCGKAAAPGPKIVPPFKSVRLTQRTHNFGYMVSKKNMYWDHLVHIGFSNAGGRTDSPPREDWYEKVWLTWHPDTKNENLHPSKGYEHFYPKAVPYDRNDLPETIKRKYGI